MKVEHGEGSALCLMCDRRHDMSISQRFCSWSCQQVYAWRRRMGYFVKAG